MTTCDHKSCPEHVDVVIATRVNKAIMITLGSLGTILIGILITISTMSYKGLQQHKEDSLSRDTMTQVQLENLAGHGRLMDARFENMSDNIARVNNGVENIQQILSNDAKFATAQPTSTLRVFAYE